jgi:hypothetical protein
VKHTGYLLGKFYYHRRKKSDYSFSQERSSVGHC